MDRRHHWNSVYSTKGEQDVSWFETLPAVSLEMIEAAGVDRHTCVLDVGGGDSRLIDSLAARNMECLAVLDVSGAALGRARQRLGSAASVPMWIEADVTGSWSLKSMDIWHDRAVFHFLTAREDRSRYKIHMREVLKPGAARSWQRSLPMAQRSAADCPLPDTRPRCLQRNLVRTSRWLKLGHTSTAPPGVQYSHFNIRGSSEHLARQRFAQRQLAICVLRACIA